MPLWPEHNPLSGIWSSSIPVLKDAPGGDFWIDWYQRALDCRPHSWSLLRDIALIDDTQWKQGGEALDREIRQISDRHRLLEEVRRLKAALSQAGLDGILAPHRRHNDPPERLCDQADAAVAAAQSVVEQLEQAEQELEKQQPSASRLRAVARLLRQAVISVVEYGAGLADEVLRGAAREIGGSVGKWTGPAVVTWILSQNLDLHRLADAMLQYADLFIP